MDEPTWKVQGREPRWGSAQDQFLGSRDGMERIESGSGGQEGRTQSTTPLGVTGHYWISRAKA